MRSSIAFVFLLVFSLPGFADDLPKEAARAIQLQNRVCFGACAKRISLCTKQGAAEERCDAEYIGCASSCSTCVSQFQTCVRSGIVPDLCQPPFVKCLKAGIASRLAKGSPPRFADGDGISQITAVVVIASNEREGVLAEHLWVLRHHEAWRQTNQALIHDGGRSFDKIGYTTPEGDRELWFDITSFFGKL